MSQVKATAVGRRANIRGEHSRTRLLEAALTSLSERGFHGTSTRDIAAAAGMSPAAVYAHYATKEELLYRLSIDGHKAVRDLVALHAAADTPPDERLRRAAAEFASWHAQHNTRARVLQYELAALSESHAEEVYAVRRQTEESFRHLVRDGHEAGTFTVVDINSTALAILSLGIDVARWYNPGGTWSPQDVGARYGILALRIVGADTSE